MSQKYTGGFITKSPVAPTTSAASGIWTLDQQQQAQKAGTWPSPPIFIEDYFSTYLVTGDGTAPAVNNGIDLSTKGGLVWIKKRSAAGSHSLFDTARGANLRLISNGTAAQDSVNLSFTTTGFSNYTLDSGVTYASWSWAKAPKFFDVVTTTSQTFSHSLASVAGCVIWKRTDATEDWNVVSRKADGSYVQLNLNLTDGAFASYANATAAGITSTTITLPSFTTGATYVAYLFAHDAGGFPVSGGGSTNGISCGSFTGTGATGNAITLGYEPQFVIVKRTDTTADWITMDAMRGGYLKPNTSDAELGGSGWFNVGGDNFFPTATGFQVNTSGAAWNASGGTYIYIAIRRGPMAVPTSGTSVFAPLTYTGNGTSGRYISGAGFPPDLIIQTARSASENREFDDRLRGGGSTAMNALFSNSTNAEAVDSGSVQLLNQDGFTVRSFGNYSSVTYIGECFRRAPSFFDEVCYTGNGSTQTITHNLTVVPELIIAKNRGQAGNNWPVLFNFASTTMNYGFLNLTNSCPNDTYANVGVFSAAPTATTFSLINSSSMNASGYGIVAYLFATCAGVSKVGTYTGTGALQTVNCGFTAGARFVLIKRTDSTGDWYTYDSARGITSGDDPYLFLNSTAAEVTGTNYVDTDTTGFQVTAAAPAGLNANGGTYIFLAIA